MQLCKAFFHRHYGKIQLKRMCQNIVCSPDTLRSFHTCHPSVSFGIVSQSVKSRNYVKMFKHISDPISMKIKGGTVLNRIVLIKQFSKTYSWRSRSIIINSYD